MNDLPDSRETRKEYSDSLDMLLFGWTSREALFELAKILHGLLDRIHAEGDPMAAFVAHERVRGRLLLPETSPYYNEWLFYPELLAAFVALDMHTIDMYTLSVSLRAVAILLLVYDRRVRRLMLCPHAWHDKCKMQPPNNRETFTFLHKTLGIQQDCDIFLNFLRDPMLPLEAEQTVARSFVDAVIDIKKSGGRIVRVEEEEEAQPEEDAMDIG